MKELKGQANKVVVTKNSLRIAETKVLKVKYKDNMTETLTKDVYQQWERQRSNRWYDHISGIQEQRLIYI